MKQILQDLGSGELTLSEVARPKLRASSLLIQTRVSLVSAGTERMLVDFGRASLLGKARQHPERIKAVVDKIATEGLVSTLAAVKSKLDEPIPLGYSNVGRVIGVGQDVSGFELGDRVVSNGPHAEVVCVPAHLCALVPDEVSDDDGAFTVISSVALQGVRLIAPTLGESVAVLGLGLVGLIAVQLLRASGARVIGFDPDPTRVAMARAFGADALVLDENADPVDTARRFSRGHGVDAVLIAATTDSDLLIQQAAQMSRVRGRLVLTGVTGLKLNRADFYEKELTFQVSCSYGPGRYDRRYEELGHDYPIGFVRWTENRNFVAVLDMLAEQRIRVKELVPNAFDFDDANGAYDALVAGEDVGILLRYRTDADDAISSPDNVVDHRPGGEPAAVTVGVIGAGNFARRQMLPAIRGRGTRLKWVASANGFAGAQAARKFAVEHSTTDHHLILDDGDVNTVFIATRHDLHAPMVVDALKAGKHVFVEKPLCIREAELDAIEDAYRDARGSILMVGFNRRFSPLVTPITKTLAARSGPIAMTYVVNAGALPPDHWLCDPQVGGGRLVGEACHFIDLMHFLTGAPIERVAGFPQAGDDAARDSFSLALSFADGSVGNINYFAEGSRRYPKERLTLFFDEKTLELDNFRKLRSYGMASVRARRWAPDKGHRQSFAAFVAAVRDGSEAPIPASELFHVTRASFAARTALERGDVVEL